MSLLIRVAEEDDLLPLLRLFSRADEGLNPAVSAAERSEVSTWSEMLRTDNLTTYVAVIDGVLIGTALFVMIPNLGYGCRRSGFIEAMMVSSKHRRDGVATQLLHRILDDARASGCHKIQLLTHKRHATDGAHAFYRSIGFESEAEGFRLYLDSD